MPVLRYEIDSIAGAARWAGKTGGEHLGGIKADCSTITSHEARRGRPGRRDHGLLALRRRGRVSLRTGLAVRRRGAAATVRPRAGTRAPPAARLPVATASSAVRAARSAISSVRKA